MLGRLCKNSVPGTLLPEPSHPPCSMQISWDYIPVSKHYNTFLSEANSENSLAGTLQSEHCGEKKRLGAGRVQSDDRKHQGSSGGKQRKSKRRADRFRAPATHSLPVLGPCPAMSTASPSLSADLRSWFVLAACWAPSFCKMSKIK